MPKTEKPSEEAQAAREELIRATEEAIRELRRVRRALEKIVAKARAQKEAISPLYLS